VCVPCFCARTLSPWPELTPSCSPHDIRPTRVACAGFVNYLAPPPTSPLHKLAIEQVVCSPEPYNTVTSLYRLVPTTGPIDLQLTTMDYGSFSFAPTPQPFHFIGLPPTPSYTGEDGKIGPTVRAEDPDSEPCVQISSSALISERGI
jgi:hypothetical protein